MTNLRLIGAAILSLAIAGPAMAATVTDREMPTGYRRGGPVIHHCGPRTLIISTSALPVRPITQAGAAPMATAIIPARSIRILDRLIGDLVLTTDAVPDDLILGWLLGRFQPLDFRLELKAQLRAFVVGKPVRHLRKDRSIKKHRLGLPRKLLRRAGLGQNFL